MKKFLAFKGVNENYNSAFITGVLAKKYTVGKRSQSPIDLPMFLLPPDVNSDLKSSYCAAAIKRILLVEVNEKHLKNNGKYAPWLDGDYQGVVPPLSLKHTRRHITYDYSPARKYYLTSYLKVLEELPMGQFDDYDKAMQYYEVKYGLPRMPLAK